ncbi:MAG: hypothetical protein JJU29_19930 [Verrucomicrobia bacterium]|nr:hypothetical protein [Verrucomicrobiota bacterium]
MNTQSYMQYAALTCLLWGGVAMASGGQSGGISVNRSSMRPLTERERQNAPVVMEYRGPQRTHVHQRGDRHQDVERRYRDRDEVKGVHKRGHHGRHRENPVILVPAQDGRGYIVVGPVRRTPPDTRTVPNLRPAQVAPRNEENFVNTPPPLRAAQIAPRE